MSLCAEPVHSALEQRESSCSLGLDERFSLAFFALASSFRDEQAPIAERAHEIRQILVGLALEHVVDAIGSPKVSDQAVSGGTGRTGIAALIITHMRLIF